MDDLTGPAAARLERFEALRAEGALPAEWLERQLRAALEELAEVEPIADAEQERREDF
ncbi:hypothetical protein [Microbacterium sp. 10M-3C3]|jgi:hypothetical protein|uniref:hypothetical protein n=1 Tax=Microbacterium sp. 10M-3C3 TaxID=2483401 RepID=UPI0013DD9A03|nr:hypothetical protein [Microbacterium sp. 10M-3C3]